jgi:hypothetical protein
LPLYLSRASLVDLYPDYVGGQVLSSDLCSSLESRLLCLEPFASTDYAEPKFPSGDHGFYVREVIDVLVDNSIELAIYNVRSPNNFVTFAVQFMRMLKKIIEGAYESHFG